MIKKTTIIVAAILLVMGICAGCGGQQTGTSNAASPETTIAETTAADTAAAETTAADTAAAETMAADTAASGSTDLSQYAGEYVFYGTYLDDYYVTIEDLEGTSTVLDADGTGYLNWGKNNEGPIKEWTADGNDITIKAGISTISGQISDGVMILHIGDPGSEFLECYVTEDADTSQMPRITAEEWAKMIVDSIE